MFKVVAVTSQNEVHPVESIQTKETYRMWQTDGDCDKAVIEMEFYKPTKIKHLEIGTFDRFSF